MPTAPYVHHQPTKPDIADTGTQVIDDSRTNSNAVRDSVIMMAHAGWDMSVTVGGGSASQPDSVEFAEGTERLQMNFTWGASGYPTQIIYKYSSDSGGSYVTIGTETISYDANENVTGIAWT